jgi:hypothetical protein
MSEPKTVAVPQIDFSKIRLKRGGHDAGTEDCCLFEAVSLRMGCAKKTDHPPGVSPVLNAMGIGLNDAFADNEAGDQRRTELLLPFLDRLPDSNGSPALELRRQYLLLDWAVRVYAPKWYELVDALKPHAQTLRNLPEITDLSSAQAALQAVGIARDAAAKHYDGVRAGVLDGVLDGVLAGVLDGVLDGVRAGVLAVSGVRAGVLDGVRAGVRDGVLDGVLDGVRAGVLDGVLDGVRAGVLDGVLDGEIHERLLKATTYDDGWTIAYAAIRPAIEKSDVAKAQLKRVNEIGTEIEDSAVVLFDRLLSLKD